MRDSRNLLLLLPGHSEGQRGAGVWQEGEGQFSPGCRAWHCHLCHQEHSPRATQLSGRDWWLPLLTLQDLGPFTRLPQGSCGTCSHSQALKAPVWGHRSQDLVLVLQPNPCTCAVLCLQPWSGGQGGAAFMALSWAMGPGWGVLDGDSHGIGKSLDL